MNDINTMSTNPPAPDISDRYRNVRIIIYNNNGTTVLFDDNFYIEKDNQLLVSNRPNEGRGRLYFLELGDDITRIEGFYDYQGVGLYVGVSLSPLSQYEILDEDPYYIEQDVETAIFYLVEREAGVLVFMPNYTGFDSAGTIMTIEQGQTARVACQNKLMPDDIHIGVPVIENGSYADVYLGDNNIHLLQIEEGQEGVIQCNKKIMEDDIYIYYY